MLSESVPIANSSTSSPVDAPWIFVETACAGQAIIDVHACWDRVVLRRALPRTLVSDGVMVAPLGARQRQSQGWEFQMSGGGARRICASCFACSWSSWALQKSFLPQQEEKKNLSEPHKVASEF